ncbi:MAG: beta-ketoacyl synthase N-terminal-like domain-containing protein [Polyangiales bacterium]
MPSAAPVSIRGTGAVSAAGHGVDALWRAVLDGSPLAQRVTRYDTAALSTRRAALIPSAPRATASHRAAAYAIDALHEATRGDLPRDAALFVGTSLGATDAWEPWHRAHALGRELPPPRDTTHADTARAVADALSLRGPVVTVSTACTSSSAALIEAADAIRLGEVDDALVVGVDVLGLFVHAGFDRLGALSPDEHAPAPFGLGRRGMWLGEAAATRSTPLALRGNPHRALPRRRRRQRRRPHDRARPRGRRARARDRVGAARRRPHRG